MAEEESPELALGLSSLSPPLRVSLCSPDISHLLGQQCLAELSTHCPETEYALAREDSEDVNRVFVQPVALLPGSDPAAAAVVARLKRLRFTAEYFGLTAKPICLELDGSDATNESGVAGGKGLVGAGSGATPALEFMLPSLGSSSVEGGGNTELFAYLRTRPLQVDVWDADSGFALGCVKIPGQIRCARQGRAAVYYYDICPFLQPLPPTEASAARSEGAMGGCAGSTDTKEVQVTGLDLSAAVAFRLVCVGDDRAGGGTEEASGGWGVLCGSPTKKGGGGDTVTSASYAREMLDDLLKLTQGGEGYVGWHRVRADQNALPQRAALALVFVNQERVLSSLRAEAQARVAATLGSAIGEAGPRCKWSEHPLTAAGLTGPLAPLALDALHLHALCLSLQAAAAAGGGGDVVAEHMDVQRMLTDSRHSPSLEMVGDVAIGRMEALEVTARRALQRLMRDILAAMVGSSLHTMRDPVALFARAAPTGILDASGFHQLVSTLEVPASDSLVFAGWRALNSDANSADGVDVATFLGFFSVNAVARQQRCSLELLRARPAAEEEGATGAGGGEGLRQLKRLKELLVESELWQEYRRAAAAARIANASSADDGSKSGDRASVAATGVGVGAGVSGKVSGLEDLSKTRDDALGKLVRELRLTVAGITDDELKESLRALDESIVADNARKAMRLRALRAKLLTGTPAHSATMDESVGTGGQDAGGAGGKGAGDAAATGGGAKVDGVNGDVGLRSSRGGSGDDEHESRVRRALEAQGLLLDAGRGGTWAPAKVRAEVPFGCAGTRLQCPLENRCGQLMCFEALVDEEAAAADSGGVQGEGGGSVRIDDEDQELQLLQTFHMCVFVEAATKTRTSGPTGLVGAKGAAGYGGAMGVRFVVQPRARVTVPLLFLRGNMRAGATVQRSVRIRMRRAAPDTDGRETFAGDVVVEESLVVCGSVLVPRPDDWVRLLVPEFNQRFMAGDEFALRKHLRFPHAGVSEAGGDEKGELAEVWLTIATTGKEAQNAGHAQGAGLRQEGHGGQRVVVQGDVMRYEKRRWVKDPDQELSKRLVTEPLPGWGGGGESGEGGYVHYFCTSLLAPPERRNGGGSKSTAWVAQWGGDVMRAGTGRGVELGTVVRQWLWEVRSMTALTVRVPPAPIPAGASATGTSEALADPDTIAVADSGHVADSGSKLSGSGAVVGARDDVDSGWGAGSAGWQKAEAYDVQMVLERPLSLWGEAKRGLVHTSAPNAVRSKGGAAVRLGGESRVAVELEVKHAHDGSPVFLHVVSEQGVVLSAWVLTFSHAAKATLQPCGLTIALEELRLTADSVVLPAGIGARTDDGSRGGGQQKIALDDVKTRLRNDLSATLGCDSARVHVVKLAKRGTMDHAAALDVFRSLDTDGSGRLEQRELKLALRRMRLHGVMLSDINDLLAILDPSGDGQVTFEEFVSALDAGIDAHLLLLPPPTTLDNEQGRFSGGHPAQTLTPLALAEMLLGFVSDSPYGRSRRGAGSPLVGLLSLCGEVEVVPTGARVVRGETLQNRSAVAIQRRVRGVQTRLRTQRLRAGSGEVGEVIGDHGAAAVAGGQSEEDELLGHSAQFYDQMAVLAAEQADRHDEAAAEVAAVQRAQEPDTSATTRGDATAAASSDHDLKEEPAPSTSSVADDLDSATVVPATVVDASRETEGQEAQPPAVAEVKTQQGVIEDNSDVEARIDVGDLPTEGLDLHSAQKDAAATESVATEAEGSGGSTGNNASPAVRRGAEVKTRSAHVLAAAAAQEQEEEEAQAEDVSDVSASDDDEGASPGSLAAPAAQDGHTESASAPLTSSSDARLISSSTSEVPDKIKGEEDEPGEAETRRLRKTGGDATEAEAEEDGASEVTDSDESVHGPQTAREASEYHTEAEVGGKDAAAAVSAAAAKGRKNEAQEHVEEAEEDGAEDVTDSD